MQLFKLSVPMWKGVLATVAIASALLFFSELRHAYQPLTEGYHGSLGVVLNDQVGLSPDGQDSNRLRIIQVIPDGSLGVAGANVGDFVSFARPIDRWRKLSIGEEVTLIILQGDNERQVSVVAQAVPITTGEYVDYLSRALLAFPALIFALMIGFKGAGDPANRRLAMTFIALGLNIYYNFNYSPGDPVFALSKLASLTTYGLIWFGAAAFALSYRNKAIAQTSPELAAALQTDWLNRLYPWYRALAALIFVYSFWFAFGYETPGLWALGFAGVIGGLLMIVISLTDGWRRTRGELRQRHSWLLFSILANAVPSFLTWIPAFDWTVNGVLLTVVLSFVGQLIMFIGLTYAVLKHRIFNFSFAISRALITSTISLLLLAVFEVLKLVFEEILQGGSNESTLQRRDLVIAVILFLVFHRVHDQVKNFLERFFFQSWYQNEKRLRKFVKDAAHILSVDALLTALVSALDRFTYAAGAAIYLLEPAGNYKLVASSMTLAPATLDADDGLVVGLRSAMAAQQPEDSPVKTAFRCELALPMSHRGQLHGFIALGTKGNDAAYRPDELSVLGFAAHQIGLDLLAFRVTTLETALRQVLGHHMPLPLTA